MIKTKNLTYKIMRESFFILLITSVISTIGGIGLESVQEKLFVFLPFLIAIPAKNDLIGDFGGIVSSKFTTLLYLGKVTQENWWKSKSLRILFFKIVTTSILSSFYLVFLAILVSLIKGSSFSLLFYFKFIFLFFIISLVLVCLIFIISIIGGIYTYKKNKDPDNFLIPITTSIADLSTMVILALVIRWFL